MCARRVDRHDTVVPELEAIVAEQAAAIGDRDRTGPTIVRFHRAIIEGCGNASLVVVVNALEAVWAGHEVRVYDTHDERVPTDLRLWRASLRDHERILKAIAKGDSHQAALLVARHGEASHGWISESEGMRVSASATAAVTRGRRRPVR
jgi:DNA-binding FadR family transcriptional regulator